MAIGLPQLYVMSRFFGSRSRSASPSQATDIDPPVVQRMPILGRRWLAWGLEVAILAASVGVPMALGNAVQYRATESDPAPAPVLRVLQRQGARWLGISPRSLPQQVPPLAQLLWTGALGLPLILAGVYLHGLSQRGQAGPKRWLGLQVVTLAGQAPGWRRTLRREVVGRWGLPLTLAYGLWRVSGLFPQPWVLLGFALGTLITGNATACWHPTRRSWADHLGDTCVVDQGTGLVVRLSAHWEGESQPQITTLTWSHPRGQGGESLEQNGQAPRQSAPPWRWGVVVVAGMATLGLMGLGAYSLWQRQRTLAANQALFASLVTTLTNSEAGIEAQRTAVLALGSLPDERATPLLVDLITQAEDPQWLDTLQQALVNRGREALPALKRLNRNLSRDLVNQGAGPGRQAVLMRLHTVNQVILQVVALAGDRTPELDLSGINLGHLSTERGTFFLDLPQHTLAGSRWRGAVMNRAQLQQARFFHPGADQRFDTYDDRTSDLSGADLTDADLSGADLTLSQLVGASLLRVALPQGNLTLANLSRANLEGANLIQAELAQATLVQTRLIAADLTTAQFPGANLREARMRRVTADGANFTGADLQDVEAQEALFTTADFTNANLTGANLTGASLVGAQLAGADLQNASLQGADLRQVSLEGAKLAGANFAGALLVAGDTGVTEGFVAAAPEVERGNRLQGVDFNGVRNLDGTQLTYICAQGGLHAACAQF